MRLPDPKHEIERLLRRNPVVGVLAQHERDALAALGRIERYRRPTLLNAAREPLEWIRLVIQGHVQVIARNAAGGEVALGDIGPGGWATWVGCFAPDPPEHDFYSSSAARFLALPTRAVRAVAGRNPELFPHVIAELGTRMRQLMEWAGDSVLMGPEQRMAKLLHLMARGHGITANSGDLQVTQTRLALVARCSRQSANLLVGALERRGLVTTGYGRFGIPDMAALAAFTAGDISDR